MVSDIRHILNGEAGADGRHRLVSVTHVLSITKCTLTVAQTQDRSAISTTERSSGLHLHLVYLGNYHLPHQGSALDATN